MTLDELYAELRELDEIDLLELLDITSVEIVDTFHNRIQKRRKYLEEKLAGTKAERGDPDPWSLYQESSTE
jgi:molybdopterin converting factor small subunit